MRSSWENRDLRWAVVVSLAACYHAIPSDNGKHDAGSADARADGPADATLVPIDAVPTMLVQEMAAGIASGSALSVTLPAAPATNHTLIAIGGCANGLSGDTITGAATWTPVDKSKVSATEYVWIGVPDGTKTATITTGNPGAMFLLVTEWSGLDLTTPIETHSANGSNGSGTINLTIPETSSPELVVFAVSSYGAVNAPSNTWTVLLDATTGTTLIQKSWYQLVWGAGSVAAQTTYSQDYDAVLAGFRTAP